MLSIAKTPLGSGVFAWWVGKDSNRREARDLACSIAIKALLLAKIRTSTFDRCLSFFRYYLLIHGTLLSPGLIAFSRRFRREFAFSPKHNRPYPGLVSVAPLGSSKRTTQEHAMARHRVSVWEVGRLEDA